MNFFIVPGTSDHFLNKSLISPNGWSLLPTREFFFFLTEMGMGYSYEEDFFRKRGE